MSRLVGILKDATGGQDELKRFLTPELMEQALRENAALYDEEWGRAPEGEGSGWPALR